MKICGKCGQEKESIFFHRNRRHRDGRHSVCVECVRESSRRRREAGHKPVPSLEPAGYCRWTYSEDVALLSAPSLRSASVRLGRSYDAVRIRRQYLAGTQA